MKNILALVCLLSSTCFAETVAERLAKGIPSGGGAITPAKGSLWVGTTTAFSSLATGTNGQVLTLDSAQTLGVKWAVASGTPGTGVIVDSMVSATAAIQASKLDLTLSHQTITSTPGNDGVNALLIKNDAGSGILAIGVDVGGNGSITCAGTIGATTFNGALTGNVTGTASGNLVSGGALGTPSSGNGSNLTALNASNLASGTVAAARLPSGTLTNTQVATITADVGTTNNFAACVTTGLSCAITTSSASSKVRIEIYSAYGDNGGGDWMYSAVKRGGTLLGPGNQHLGVKSVYEHAGSWTTIYYDSPGSAGTFTYEAFFSNDGGAATVYFLRSSTGFGCIASMTVTEILP